MPDPSAPAGLDPAALTGWLDAEHPGLRRGPLRVALITGGLSNLTYAVTDGEHRWAVRRPPLGHMLPTAHDMAREFRIITALQGTAVPVAPPVVLCEDPTVVGAPFYVMGFVDGIVLDRASLIAGLDRAAAARTGDLLVEVLLALHGLDPAAVGLDTLGHPEGFLPRQVRRWTQQWEASVTEERPRVAPLVERLAATVPEPSAPGIVHGDYRLTNVIYDAGVTRIEAVVDWEMATVGDPLSDVGLLVVYHRLAASGGFVMPNLSPEAGFATPDALVGAYAAGSPRSVDSLPWYVAFAWFKLAVIAEGIHRRHLQRQTVGAGFEQIGRWVPILLDNALQALDG